MVIAYTISSAYREPTTGTYNNTPLVNPGEFPSWNNGAYKISSLETKHNLVSLG